MKENVYRLFYWIFSVPLHLLFRIRYRYRERVPQEGAMLVCASHSHWSDPFFLLPLLGVRRPIHFMAKDELLHLPVVGPFLRAVGSFGVTRGRPDVSAIRMALRILQSGCVLGIFPEGTRRAESTGEVKRGAIVLAARTGVPLVPVYIPRKKPLFGRITVVVGKPYVVEKQKSNELYEPYAEELLRRIEGLKGEAK